MVPKRQGESYTHDRQEKTPQPFSTECDPCGTPQPTVPKKPRPPKSNAQNQALSFQYPGRLLE